MTCQELADFILDFVEGRLPEDQAKMGLSPGLLRLSIGYTGSVEGRVAQIVRAVRKMGLACP